MNSVLRGALSRFRGVADLFQLTIGIAGSVVSVTIFLIPVFAFAQGPAIVTPAQLVWKPLIPGVEMAVVAGDPDKRGGLYVIRTLKKGQAKGRPPGIPNRET